MQTQHQPSDHSIRPIDDYGKFSHEYQLSRKIFVDKISTEIYVDASDMIAMIAGFANLEDKRINKFRMEDYHKPAYLVYSFAYRQWLGEIHIFPPHLQEMLEKTKHSPNLFPSNPNELRKAWEDEFWGNSFKLNFLRNADLEKDSQLAEYIKYNIKDLFKGYFLSRESDWRARYKYMKEHKVFCEPKPEDYPQADMEKQPLFEAIRQELTKVRPKKPYNNYIDAISLYLLNKKLEEHHNKPSEKPLPIMYSDHFLLRNIADTLSKDSYLGKPFLFEEKYLIVQPADFFIDYGIRRTRQSLHGEHNLLKKLDEVIQGDTRHYNSLLPPDKDLTEDSLHMVFLEDFWWKKNGNVEFNDLVVQMRKNPPTEDEMKNIQEKLDAYWKEEVTKLEENLSPILLKNNLAKKAWKALAKLSDGKLKRLLPDDVQFDMLNLHDELGIRFNFPNTVCDEAKSLLDELYKSHKQNDIEGYEEHVYKVVLDLVEGAMDPAQSYKFSKGLAVCWALREYALIDQLCDVNREACDKLGSEDKYPSYPIAMVHAAAIILSSGIRKKERSLRILDCIKMKGKFTYHMAIGMSYVLNTLWYEHKRYFEVPELIAESDRDNILDTEEILFQRSASDYSLIAIDELKNKIKIKDEKQDDRRRKLNYSINNYLYCITFHLPEQEFLDKMGYAKQLEAKEGTSFWQPRFADTLAWFYFRCCVIYRKNNTLDRMKAFLKKARDYNNKSIEQAQDSQVKEKYKKLKYKIEEEFGEDENIATSNAILTSSEA